MFAGKGGVGKTTMSVSMAMFLARMGKNVFLLSTDPSGSLGDIFGDDPKDRVVYPLKGLSVVELSRDGIIKRWKEKFGDEIYTVVSSIVPVGREILDYLEGAPGIDEEFVLDYLLGLWDSSRYDFIVWDTAPTSSTLSLLRIQLLFYSHLSDAQKLYLRLKGFFKGGESPIKLIGKWRDLTERIISMLREDTLCFIVVTPEKLPTVQGLRLKDELSSFGIPLGGFVLNRRIPEVVAHSSRFLEIRSSVQGRWEKHLEEHSDIPVLRIEEMPSPDLSFEDYSRIGSLLIHGFC